MGFSGNPAPAQLIKFTSEIKFHQLIVFTVMKQTGLPRILGGHTVNWSHLALPPQTYTSGSHPAIAIRLSDSPAIS